MLDTTLDSGDTMVSKKDKIPYSLYPYSSGTILKNE